MIRTTILDQLNSKGYVVIPTKGISMQPLLYTYKTHVLILKLQSAPKKNDVVLYLRENGDLVLHRVIKIKGNTALIRGDNTFNLEQVPIENIKGILEKVWKGRREISVLDKSYKAYVHFWNTIYPIRAAKNKCKSAFYTFANQTLGDSTLGWIIKMIHGNFGKVLILTLCSGVNALLGVLLALVLRQTVDFAAAKDLNGFITCSGIFAVIIATQITVRAVIRQFSEYSVATVENKLKQYVYESILHSRYSSITKFHTGELQNYITNDVKVVANESITILPGMASMLVQLIFAVIILIVLDWRFGVLFLLGGCVFLGVTLLFRRRMKTLHKEVQTADGFLRSWLQESVESILVLKGLEAEDMVAEQADKRMENYKKVKMKKEVFSNFCNLGFGTIMQGSYLLGLIWCGLGLMNNTLTYGTLMAILQLVNQIRSPFANISGFVPRYYSMIGSAERLIEIDSLPKDAGAIQCLPQFDRIQADNLAFLYNDGNSEVIRNASFTINRGDLVILTGISGIGKSTLLKLLMGVYTPVSGRLYGVCGDTEIPIDSKTRPWFSFVPQGNMLMSGSIYQIVDFLNTGTYTKGEKERIRKACKIACADEFIQKLPEGYDTVLGEKGAGLSEGQMQRLAIARAIYRNSLVLLLDEATSALDEETEHKLLSNLKEIKNQTVIFVTHRHSTKHICNKQLVFKDGSVRILKH